MKKGWVRRQLHDARWMIMLGLHIVFVVPPLKLQMMIERLKIAVRSSPSLNALCTTTNALITLVACMLVIGVTLLVPHLTLPAIIIGFSAWLLIAIASSRELFLHWQATVNAAKPGTLTRMQNERVFVAWIRHRVDDETQTGLATGRISPNDVDEATRYTFARHNAEYWLWEMSERRSIQCLATATLALVICVDYAKKRFFSRKKQS